MNSSLTFQYPLWWIGLCVLLGILFAVILYFRDQTFKDASTTQKRFIPLLALLRFLGATSIATLLLSPLIKDRFTEVQKPYVVIAQDNSESIAKTFKDQDSLNYSAGIQNLVEALNEDAEIQHFIFDGKLKEETEPNYTGKVTNLSATLEDIYNRFSYQNVGAVILATDGIYNEGSNPIYSNFEMDAPLYTVALGDTTPTRDLRIDKVLHNRIAYRGDKFTIRVDISAFNAKGSTTVMNVYKGKGTSNKVHSKNITIKEDRFFTSEEVILDADRTGIRQFTITLTKIKDEENTTNNYQTIYVDVLEGRQKILILANSPHPDLSALKQSIETNKNYEAKIVYQDKFDGNVKDQNLVILHGIPSKKNDGKTLVDKLKSANIPTWFITTTQTNMAALDKLQDIVKISGANNSTNDVQSVYDGSFNLFTYEGTEAQKIEDFPPLVAPFAQYEASPTAQVLFKQKIGSVDTDYPLWILQQSKNYKTAVLCGEGFWRWRVYDYLKNQSHVNINNLVSKTIQYLAVKNDKRQFRVNQPKNLFNENENIFFDAEFYNDSYELINEPEATLRVTNADGQDYPFTFSRTASAYTLDAGQLPTGDYDYVGKAVYNGKEFKSSGKFTVKELLLEAVQTTADHGMLQNLSSNFGGEVVRVNDLAGLAAKIKEHKEMKPKMFNTYKTRSVINLKWLFFIILAMLSLEWFFRKYNGAY